MYSFFLNAEKTLPPLVNQDGEEKREMVQERIGQANS